MSCRRFILFLCLVLPIASPLLSLAQNRELISTPYDLHGVPYYRHYGAKDFDSSASSSFITSTNDGSIVYGDLNWIFMFDGISWRKLYHNLTESHRITSMHWDVDGEIYAGSFNSIGKIGVGENEKITYIPLDTESNRIDVGEYFQTIHTTPTDIYFRGRRSFAIYSKETGHIDWHRFDTWITASFFHQGRYHIVKDSNEILFYENGEFTQLDDLTRAAQRRDITVADTIVAPDGSIIMASERRGLYRFNGESIEPAFPAFNADTAHLVRDIELTDDGHLLVASIGRGVVVLDPEGNVLEDFGAAIDHRFKSARNVMIDQYGSVWVMFNASLAKILLDTPLTAIDERLRPSLFYASPYSQGDDLYLLSFYILYKADFDRYGRISGFHNLFPNTDMEITAVGETKHGLYFGTNHHGLFKLDENDQAIYLMDAPAFDRLKQSRDHPDLLIGTNSSNIWLLKASGETLARIDAIDNDRFVNRMQQDDQGVFWLEYGLGAVGKLEVHDDKLSLDVIHASDDALLNHWFTLWMHEGRAYFTIPDGVYTHDATTDQLVKTNILDTTFDPNHLRIERAITDPYGNIWISANGANMILWKQEDGSFQIDDRSLLEMGEPFFEFLKFYEGNETIIVTAFELFHYKSFEDDSRQIPAVPATRIARIQNLESQAILFEDLGISQQPEFLTLDFRNNDIVFNVANPFSFSTKSPEFQYQLLESTNTSLPDDNKPWNSSSITYYTNLSPGSYVFKARTKAGDGRITPWIEYAFEVSTPYYATAYAYLVYFITGALVIYALVKLKLRGLHLRNLKLEKMVQDRTHEIESKNSELERQAGMLATKNRELARQSEETSRNAQQLEKALAQLQETQDKLLDTARTAGRAEVATNVLHNVGNVLNSVNISLSSLSEKLAESSTANFSKIVELIQQHSNTLETFLTQDPKGKNLPAYMEQLSKVLMEEIEDCLKEINGMTRSVEHLREVISTQQSYARAIGLNQEFDLVEVIDSAIRISTGDTTPAHYNIEKRIDPDLVLDSDKHKVLEIFVNILKNAIESIEEHGPAEPRIVITAKASGSSITANIVDNGKGIEPNHQARLFRHGFTTKPNGHGFGLHSCANSAKNLGGDLQLQSEGPGLGATATLQLPIKAPAQKAP